jgi:hypothetical protein
VYQTVVVFGFLENPVEFIKNWWLKTDTSLQSSIRLASTLIQNFVKAIDNNLCL